jgi:hypothetical protein
LAVGFQRSAGGGVMIKLKITEDAKGYLSASTFVDYVDTEEIIQVLTGMLGIECAPDWISVKDKLPENRVGKIVFCEDGSITTMYYDPDNKYWVSQMGFDRYDVTHWMEKPAPPKVEREEEVM